MKKSTYTIYAENNIANKSQSLDWYFSQMGSNFNVLLYISTIAYETPSFLKLNHQELFWLPHFKLKRSIIISSKRWAPQVACLYRQNVPMLDSLNKSTSIWLKFKLLQLQVFFHQNHRKHTLGLGNWTFVVGLMCHCLY